MAGRRRPRRAWLDLGDPGAFVRPAGPLARWQDHGLGLLRTILEEADVATDVHSVRAMRSWRSLARRLARYDLLLMNVRSYTFPLAVEAARRYKARRPDGRVLVGGLHATVAPEEMRAEPAFDTIVTGAAEANIVDLVRGAGDLPREVAGQGAASMADWPFLDRTLWPRPRRRGIPWPLEPSCGWGPPPVATVLTSRSCPWRCAFCNEAAYLPTLARRPVEHVIEELNRLDRDHGPLGSVVIHDSMFFQHPAWLEVWLEAYPRLARRRWPYWAAARSDTVRRWPDLFAALVRETNWSTVSIGFESGSDRVLGILNKECTVEDHRVTIDLLTRLGDEAAAAGREPPRFWANVMLGVPAETREDAYDTMAMLASMPRALPSISFYAPYPGSALGHQLIAEGESLLAATDYHRSPTDEKVRGVDYAFYRALLAGEHDAAVAARPWPPSGAAASTPSGPASFYLFDLEGGGRKLAYGRGPEDALRILADRLSAEDMARVRRDDWRTVPPRDVLAHRHELA